MATADKELFRQVRQALPVWNISSPAEVLLELLPRYSDDYQRSLIAIRSERDRLVNNLNQLNGIECFPTHANFVLCKLDGRRPANELANRLLTGPGLLIKPLSDKVGLEQGQYVRIAVLDKHANDLLVQHIAALLDSTARDEVQLS